LQVFFSQNISKSNLSSPKSLVAVTLFQFFTSTASFKVVHLTEHSLGTLCSFFYFFLFYARSSQKVLFFFSCLKAFLARRRKKKQTNCLFLCHSDSNVSAKKRQLPSGAVHTGGKKLLRLNSSQNWKKFVKHFTKQLYQPPNMYSKTSHYYIFFITTKPCI